MEEEKYTGDQLSTEQHAPSGDETPGATGSSSGAPKKSGTFKKILYNLLLAVRGTAYPVMYILMQTLALIVVGMIVAFYKLATVGADASGMSADEAIQKLLADALNNTEIQHAAIIVAGLLMIMLIVLIQFIRRKSLKEELHLVPVSPAVCAIAVGTGITLNFVISFLISLIPEQVMKFIGENNDEPEYVGSMLIYVLAAVITAPVIEELLFRNFMYGRFRRFMPVWLSIALVSVFFGIVHGSILQGVYAGVLGILLALVFERSGSILPGVFCHLGFNAVSIIAAAYGQGLFTEGQAAAVDVFYSIALIVSFILCVPLTIMLIRSTGKKNKNIEAPADGQNTV